MKKIIFLFFKQLYKKLEKAEDLKNGRSSFCIFYKNCVNNKEKRKGACVKYG